MSAAHLKGRPTDFVGHLLGHEGAGSVLSALKYRGWATSLSAGVMGEGDSTSAAALMSVSIELSIAGLGAVDEIVRVVCGYIGLLASHPPPEWLFDEVRNVDSLRAADRVWS